MLISSVVNYYTIPMISQSHRSNGMVNNSASRDVDASTGSIAYKEQQLCIYLNIVLSVIISYPKKNELTNSAVSHVLLLIIIFYTEEGTVNLQDSAKDAVNLREMLVGSSVLSNALEMLVHLIQNVPV